MKKIILMIMGFLLVSSSAHALVEPYEKYPANEKKTFVSADEFYQKLNHDEYSEFPDSLVNIRKNTLFKNINDVFKKVDDPYGKFRVGGEGYHPDRQVYVFFTAKKNEKNILSRHAVYDAETKRRIAGGSSGIK